jgi:hypothetical protein
MLPPYPPLESLCLAQHDALQTLVAALRYRGQQPETATRAEEHWYSPTWAIEEAERVLQLPPDGQAAYLDFLLHVEIAALAYDFADELHWILYGAPRVPGHVRRAPDEVREGLQRLQELTQRANTEEG